MNAIVSGTVFQIPPHIIHCCSAKSQLIFVCWPCILQLYWISLWVWVIVLSPGLKGVHRRQHLINWIVFIFLLNSILHNSLNWLNLIHLQLVTNNEEFTSAILLIFHVSCHFFLKSPNTALFCVWLSFVCFYCAILISSSFSLPPILLIVLVVILQIALGNFLLLQLQYRREATCEGRRFILALGSGQPQPRITQWVEEHWQRIAQQARKQRQPGSVAALVTMWPLGSHHNWSQELQSRKLSQATHLLKTSPADTIIGSSLSLGSIYHYPSTWDPGNQTPNTWPLGNSQTSIQTITMNSIHNGQVWADAHSVSAEFLHSHPNALPLPSVLLSL